MTATDLRNAIKTASFDRCFVFCGDEDYLKQFYLRELRKNILTDDSFSVFNHFKFEGEKVDYKKLYDAISSPPMMTEFKLIEWHLPNFDAMKEADLQNFSDFCEGRREFPFSCVVFISTAEQFSFGNLPKNPSHQYKVVSDCADVVVFEHSTDAQLISWIERHIVHEKLSATPIVCRTLLERVGKDMNTLALEIDKLCAYAKANGKQAITEGDVHYICASSSENDAFGLTNAILNKNKKQAFDNLLDLKRKKTEPTIVLGSLSKFYGEIFVISEFMKSGLSQSDIAKKLKLHEYKVGLYMKYITKTPQKAIEKMLSLCHEADNTIKSSMTNAYTIIERLIAENV